MRLAIAATFSLVTYTSCTSSEVEPITCNMPLECLTNDGFLGQRDCLSGQLGSCQVRVSSSFVVDALGAKLNFGEITLEVPPGALSEATTLRAEVDTSPPETPTPALSNVLSFAPEGIRFAEPVTVGFRAPSSPDSLSIYWTKETQPTEFERLPTRTEGAWLFAEVSHFSRGFVGAASSMDAGVAMDAGILADAGALADAGSLDSGGPTLDAGGTMDAGVSPLAITTPSLINSDACEAQSQVLTANRSGPLVWRTLDENEVLSLDPTAPPTNPTNLVERTGELHLEGEATMSVERRSFGAEVMDPATGESARRIWRYDTGDITRYIVANGGPAVFNGVQIIPDQSRSLPGSIFRGGRGNHPCSFNTFAGVELVFNFSGPCSPGTYFGGNMDIDPVTGFFSFFGIENMALGQYCFNAHADLELTRGRSVRLDSRSYTFQIVP